jgi:hypothetical protein
MFVGKQRLQSPIPSVPDKNEAKDKDDGSREENVYEKLSFSRKFIVNTVDSDVRIGQFGKASAHEVGGSTQINGKLEPPYGRTIEQISHGSRVHDHE